MTEKQYFSATFYSHSVDFKSSLNGLGPVGFWKVGGDGLWSMFHNSTGQHPFIYPSLVHKVVISKQFHIDGISEENSCLQDAEKSGARSTILLLKKVAIPLQQIRGLFVCVCG